MKSYKYRAWLVAQFMMFCIFLGQALNSTNDNAAFFCKLGASMIFLCVFLEDWKNPAGLERLGMTFPEIYQGIKKSGYRPPVVVHLMRFLICAFFILAAYFKFFAH